MNFKNIQKNEFDHSQKIVLFVNNERACVWRLDYSVLLYESSNYYKNATMTRICEIYENGKPFNVMKMIGFLLKMKKIIIFAVLIMLEIGFLNWHLYSS